MTNKEIIELGAFKIIDNVNGAAAIFVLRYQEIYGEIICGTCRGVLYEKFLKFKKDFQENKIEIMESSIYTITKDSLIDSYMSNDAPQGHFTSENITDEVAIKLLKAGIGAGAIVRKDGKEITSEDLKKNEGEPIAKKGK